MNLKKLILIYLSFNLVSCVSALPNIELCGKLSWGAYCEYTLKDKSRMMHEMEWREIGRVSMSLEDFGELKKVLLELCKRSKNCKMTDKDFIKLENFQNKLTDEQYFHN